MTLGAANQIPNGVGKGNLLMTSGAFNLGGFSETINGLSGSGTVDGISGTPTLTVGDNDATGTFSGVIKNTAGTLGLTKLGTGTLTLSGANTFGGAIQVNGGLLVFANTGAKPAGTATTISTSSIGLGVGAVSGDYSDANVAALFNNNSLSGFNLVAGSGVALDSTAGNFTQTTGLTAARSLTKLGVNTLTLSGNNTYSGATTNSAGTLKAGSITGLSPNSAFSVATGATLDLGGFSNTIKSLSTATGTITDSSSPGSGGTLRISTALAATTSQLFTGSLGLQIYGAGTVHVLNNSANTFSGGTILGNGSGSTQTREILNGVTVGAGTPGALTGGIYGKGAITIGAVTTDLSQIMFQNPNPCTINNAIVVNSALGTDIAGTFRVDSVGNIIAGTINANLANLAFKNGGTVGSVSLTNTISGTSGLMLLASAGTSLNVILTNNGTANSYAGDTTISSVKETLTLGAANQIPNGVGKGNLLMTNGTFNLGGFSETINGLSGSGTVDGITGTPTLTVGDNNATGTFAGVIKNTAGTFALTKIGTGTLTLSGISTYSGNTTISAGKLQGVVGGSIASSTVILNAATNGVSITDNTKGWTNAALTVSAASVLEFSFGAITPSTSVSPLKITGLAAFTTTPTVSIVVNSGLAAGTYPLMTWGSTSGTAPTTAGLSVSTLAPGTVASLSISGNTLNLVIGSTAVYWDNNGAVAGFGTAAGTWAAPTTGDATQGWSSDATGGTLPVNVTTTTNNPVNFGNGATGLGGGTITVSGSVTNNNVTFASGSGEIILSGGTLNFPPSATITVNNSSNTISSVLAGAGTSLTKAGTGTLTLAGANSYAGVTTVSVGTLTATNASALGATSSNTVVSSGATLRIAGGVSIAEPISIAGNGVGGNGAISSAGNNTLTAAVTSSGGRLQTEGLDTLTLTGGITSTTPNTIMVGDFTFTNNPINVGANGINFAGDGAAIPPVTGKTIRLNAAGNSWTNALLFFAAIVRLGGNDVMPVGASVQFGWTDVDNSRSTLDLNGFNQTVATIEKGQPNVSGVNVSITGGGTLTVNQSAASKDFNGVISDGATATTLIKTNVGNLILSGANTYSGNTTISAGTLALTNSGSIANSTNLIVAGGATLNVSGVSGSFSLAASQRLSGNGTVTGPITINGTVLPGSSIGTLTLSGAVTNNGTIMAEITNGPSADKIVFSGSFRNNGGTLTVTNLGTLVNGTTYDLFDFNGGAPTGVAFSTVNLPGGLGHWNTADLLVGGTITFANNAPVAGNFGLNVAVGGSVSVAAIGKYASDANGDALTITVVSAPANGTASIVGGTNFTYVSTNSAASDSFTYTVSDGFTTSTGTVTVQTYSPVGFNILSGPTPVGGGQYELNYLGLPGQQYAIDETSSLTPPITWSPVTTNTAAANGALTFTITPANPSGFFRTRSVP